MLQKLKLEISLIRKGLIANAVRKGAVYETFGVKEIKWFRDKYLVNVNEQVEEIINEFEDWCKSFTIGKD